MNLLELDDQGNLINYREKSVEDQLERVRFLLATTLPHPTSLSSASSSEQVTPPLFSRLWRMLRRK